MRLYLFASLIITTLFAGPSLAGEGQPPTSGKSAQDQSIVVQAEPITLQKWSQRMSDHLGKSLRHPAAITGQLPSSGIVSVRFMCSETGQPTAITLNRKSGTRALDLEAMRAVSRIKSLHPMPAGLHPDQQYEANILFASSHADYQQQLASLRADADSRNTWFHRDRNVIAINAAP